MRLVALTLSLCACFAQSPEDGSRSLHQVTFGENSPNISNVRGSVTITYNCVVESSVRVAASAAAYTLPFTGSAPTLGQVSGTSIDAVGIGATGLDLLSNVAGLSGLVTVGPKTAPQSLVAGAYGIRETLAGSALGTSAIAASGLDWPSKVGLSGTTGGADYLLPFRSSSDLTAVDHGIGALPGSVLGISTDTLGLDFIKSKIGADKIHQTNYTLPFKSNSDLTVQGFSIGALLSVSVLDTSTGATGFEFSSKTAGPRTIGSGDYASPLWSSSDLAVSAHSLGVLPSGSVAGNGTGGTGLDFASQIIVSGTIRNGDYMSPFKSSSALVANTYGLGVLLSGQAPDPSRVAPGAHSLSDVTASGRIDGTNYASLFKAISDLMADGQIVTTWTLDYRAGQPR